MKNGKNLTSTQRRLLERNGYNPDEYRRVKDLPQYLQVVHKVTGKQTMVMK